MLAVTATAFHADDPLAGLRVADVRNPSPPTGWVEVAIKAAALNRHDVFSLQGIGLRADELPRILGCDGAGVDRDGNQVVVHGVIGDADAGYGDAVNDPNRSLLSERYDGTFAESVVVPALVCVVPERSRPLSDSFFTPLAVPRAVCGFAS